MNVLVLNAGSSTLKFELIRTDLELIERDDDQRIARGEIERIGGEAVIAVAAGDGPLRRRTASLRTLEAAMEWVLRWLVDPEAADLGSLSQIQAVGHRVVHGGERFRRSVLVDREFLDGLEWVGLTLDPEANRTTVDGREGRISAPDARLEAWVIPTDEELLIARDTARLVLVR